MSNLTFRSSKIVYYGPHSCLQCGITICKMAQGFGGNAFDYPAGPIYPNTEWHVHVCDPRNVLHQRALCAKERVQQELPGAEARQAAMGWLIEAGHIISGNQTYYDTEDAAWIGAKAHCFPNEGESPIDYGGKKSNNPLENTKP